MNIPPLLGLPWSSWNPSLPSTPCRPWFPSSPGSPGWTDPLGRSVPRRGSPPRWRPWGCHPGAHGPRWRSDPSPPGTWILKLNGNAWKPCSWALTWNCLEHVISFKREWVCRELSVKRPEEKKLDDWRWFFHSKRGFPSAKLPETAKQILAVKYVIVCLLFWNIQEIFSIAHRGEPTTLENPSLWVQSGRFIQKASEKLTGIESENHNFANHHVGTRSKSRRQRSLAICGLHSQWHRARSHVGHMGKEKAQIPRRGPKGQQPIGTWEVCQRYPWAQSSTNPESQTCPLGHLEPLDGSHHWAPWSEDHPTDLARSRRSWTQLTGRWPNNKDWEVWFWVRKL